MTINKKDVTVSVANDSKTYGEDDPVFDDATISEYVGEDLAGVDLSVSRSDAGDDTLGTHEGVLAIGQTAEELNAAYTNYSFTVGTGDFTIGENQTGALTVSADNVVKTYDGNAYGVEATASLQGATVKYWNDETEAYDLDESPAYTNWTDGPKTVKFQATLYG